MLRSSIGALRRWNDSERPQVTAAELARLQRPIDFWSGCVQLTTRLALAPHGDRRLEPIVLDRVIES